MTIHLRRAAAIARGLAITAAALAALAPAADAEPPPAANDPTMPTELATFAGGCFWCMEPPFEELPGVADVTAGYTGGRVPDPTYEQVSSGDTGHAEAIQVTYDPSKVTYQQLLDVFWRNIDPTAEDRQFSDKGTQYRTAIFTHTAEQARLAEASKQALAAAGTFRAPIVTQIQPAGPFYPAEDEHQGYAKRNPMRYTVYKIGSGREGFLKRAWGDERTGTAP
jgi:methionine-S-sulfoxide reductase